SLDDPFNSILFKGKNKAENVIQAHVASRQRVRLLWSPCFSSASRGTHVLFRDFAFVQCTPHNRASFLRLFWRCFRTIAKNGDLKISVGKQDDPGNLTETVRILQDLLAMKEYQCLLQMLCPDFPMDMTQKAARIVLMDDAMDCLMSFSDFLYAFQIQFYFSGEDHTSPSGLSQADYSFLENAAAIYQDLLTGKSINTVIVPTSRSATPCQRQPYSDSVSPDGVDAPHFYQCLENLSERERHR
ncbi:unnamed protein product, partial [Ranitomeya imitator]